MLKEYLQAKNISIYSLSKNSGIPYSTLNDLVNGKVDIDNCKISILTKLSKTLGLSLDNIYKLCISENNEIYSKEYKTTGTIITSNKYYYICFEYNDSKIQLKVCSTRTENRDFVKIMALWTMEDYLKEREMERLYVLLLDEKR